MRFQNSFSDEARNRKLLVVGLILVLVVSLLLIVLTRHSKPRGGGTGLNYYDPRSGETISDPLGKTKDAYGSVPDVPDVLGLAKLSSFGLTEAQLAFTQDGFTSFARSQKPKVQIISIDVSSIKHLGAGSSADQSRDVLTFNVQLDRKNLLDARLEYTGLKQVRLKLYNGKKVVFDSGELGAANSNSPTND